ncbi:MAG: orotate phosphoribosyltransferase [Methylococcaceae bacterium]|nr:orotate phosphoribosyltransferase [Methylococcaceae bacterium]
MLDYQKEFITYALECDVLKFGSFKLKSGRESPYFFNTGLFNTGAKLGKLGEFYARALIKSQLDPDMLYGPAYKGIPLVCSTTIAYAGLTGKDMPFSFNRKEAKDHGEGGELVGSALKGKVLIVDDVITAGTSVKESVDMILKAKAVPSGVLIALDRQEKAPSALTEGKGYSAIQEVMECFKIPVVSIITLEDIIHYIEAHSPEKLDAIIQYRRLYGISC